MNEKSTFTIGLDIDLSKTLKDLPIGLDKIGKLILSKFSDASEQISKGLEANIAEIKVNLAQLIGGLLLVAGAYFFIRDAIIAAGESYRGIRNLLEEEEPKRIDIEKNISAQEKILTDIIQKLDERRKLRETIGDEVFFALNERFPSDDLSMEEITKELTPLILAIKSAREELETIKYLISIANMQGEQLKNLPDLEKNIIPKEQELIIKPVFSPSELELPPDLLKELNSIGFSPELGIKILDFINKNQQLNNEIDKGNTLIDERSSLFPLLNNALAMAGGEVSAFTVGQEYMSDAVNGVMASVVSLNEKGLTPLAGQTDELADRIETASGQVEQAEGTFNTYSISLGNVNDLNKVFGVRQDQVNQTLEDGSVAFDTVGASAEEFGETLDKVENQGGFFEGIKQGFIDFVENVQSNSELMADFFANTLSQMSQSFSDLFFNVLTGKFDDLADLAKQAFEAILRAFLDLVSAIVTKQIVISIAGVFGFGKGAGAGDLLGFGKQAAGIGADLAGIFGGGGGAAGGTAIAGGATSLGTGTVAIGSGLGGISSVGSGAATVGATSVLDVSAAGGEEEYRLAA